MFIDFLGYLIVSAIEWRLSTQHDIHDDSDIPNITLLSHVRAFHNLRGNEIRLSEIQVLNLQYIFLLKSLTKTNYLYFVPLDYYLVRF